ncbi:MAG TPA: GNAT family N-acetyltransferase [Azospirillaceae bacterium]|nr:GNAT family N-acetyltransferase [Azospirillaceae bacterium]
MVPSVAADDVVILEPGWEARLEAFLAPRAATSMFLRANMRRGGLADSGGPAQGTYAALLRDGAIAGVVAHGWTGVLQLQADPADVARLAAAALARTGRPLNGAVGPWAQLAALRGDLPEAAAEPTFLSREVLFTLDLDALTPPAAVLEGRWTCRPARHEEIGFLAVWRARYRREELRFPERPGDLERATAELFPLVARGAFFVLEAGGGPAAMCSFNAELPDMVQVGGVWTPPELRCRGHARGVVGGALLAARARGVRRAVLFTAEGNLPAQAAYRSLGFKEAGDYGIVMYPQA